ncbi:MAG: maleylacetoacetate isomerase [Bradymonadia bacterium]|jgi:maleylacetoacetate isomerase
MSDITLYSYWRSSASWRVRIALALKGIAYTYHPVHLVQDGGQQHSDAYRAINPAGLLPSLQIDGLTLAESLPIMEYLDETRPDPPLLPSTPGDRAIARRLAELVNADIQPVQNLRVLQYVDAQYNAGKDGKAAWGKHWIKTGFDAMEPLLAQSAGVFSVGDTATIADCCLIPQVYNARRFKVDMAAYPTIARIDSHCATLPAFQSAHSDVQPDAVL